MPKRRLYFVKRAFALSIAAAPLVFVKFASMATVWAASSILGVLAPEAAFLSRFATCACGCARRLWLKVELHAGDLWRQFPLPPLQPPTSGPVGLALSRQDKSELFVFVCLAARLLRARPRKGARQSRLN